MHTADDTAKTHHVFAVPVGFTDRKLRSKDNKCHLSELLVKLGDVKVNRNKDNGFCTGELRQHPTQMFIEPIDLFK